MDAGTWEAIGYEIHNGTVWTVLDELWHAVDWLVPHWHWRFCQFAQNDRSRRSGR